MRKQNDIWFFDSTGCVFRNVSGQKQPYYYAIVCHDEINQHIIPVAEFVSTSHSSLAISKFLMEINSIFEQNMTKRNESVASVVVTDFSWALMNAVMHEMNRCNILNYLNWSFEILYKNNLDATFLKVMRTKLFICATHMLKNVTKGTELLVKQPKVARCFKFCFALLQNATESSEFDFYLKLIYIVFNSPGKSQAFCDAFNQLSELLKKQVASSDIDTELKLKNLYIGNQDDIFSNIYLDSNTIGSIKASSPYQSYFDNLLKAIQLEASVEPKNEYFNPKLFHLISNKLHLVPLWSGLLMKHTGVKTMVRKSRITNNPVENYFGQLKNKVLNKKTKLTTSELVCDIFNRLESQYILSYQSSCSSGLLSHKPSDLANCSEVWLKGKPAAQQKGFYYGPIDIGKQDTNDLLISNLRSLESFLTNQHNFAFIASTFLKNNQLLVKLVRLFRSIPTTLFTCQKLDLSFSNIIKLNNLADFYPLHATPDGNCFYNSISLNFFGDESMAGLVKLGAVFMLLENEQLFQRILQRVDYRESLPDFVIKVLKKSEWANEFVRSSLIDCLLVE